MHTKWKTPVSALLGIALSAVMFGQASAADIYNSRGGSTKDSPSYEAPAQSDAVRWSGFYGAIVAGYGQASNDIDVSYNYGGDGEGEGPSSYSIFGLNGISGQGAVLEAELGYDVRLPNTDLVVGVLGGYRWSGIETTAHIGELNASQEGDTAWWVGGRAGLLINDSKTVLLYGKAVYIESTPDELVLSNGKESESLDLGDRSGFGFGGGMEAAVRSLPGLFVRAEYMHYQFDEKSYALGEDVDLNVKTSEDIAKIGLVYKLNAFAD